MRGHAVMGEQGVQEGAENTSMWADVEVLFPTFTTCTGRGSELNDELGRYYGVEC
jgi:hypothetical protein